MHQVALGGQTDQLAACPEAGIDGQNRLLPQRGCQHKILEILGEYIDSLFVGLLLHRLAELVLQRRGYQALI